MIVATAGHVDHGKTRLVRALTGVDTDRLEEERRRGLTIDLGFAYADWEGRRVGFVDVPGHHRFAANMVAGVTGVDTALLVVAADDGPMPQTREHLDILRLLGIRRAVVALTKADLVDPARLAEADAELRELLAGGPLADAPRIPTSAADGTGLEALRAALLERATEADTDDRPFRFAVDRAFSVSGAGLVVTGFARAGSVAAGDELVLLPAERPVRVRSVRALDRETVRGHRGERLALNLAGAGTDDAGRGSWLAAPGCASLTRRLDACLDVLPDATLRSGLEVHVHHGAARCLGRVTVLEADGPRLLAHLSLREPIAAHHGDRLLLRDAAARSTLAGGRVLDPHPPERGRRRPERLRALAVLEDDEPGRIAAGLLALSPLALSVPALARRLACAEAAILEGVEGHGPPVVVDAADGPVLRSADAWAALQDTLVGALARFHAAQPQLGGMGEHELAAVLDPKPPRPVLRAALRDAVRAGRIARSATRYRLPEHRPRLHGPDAKRWDRVRDALVDTPRSPPTVHDLARSLDEDPRALLELLVRVHHAGEIVRVADNRFLLPEGVLELARAARETAAEAEDGLFEARAFRDRAGIGRNLAIDVLEYFDRTGLTRRRGNVRLLVGDPEVLFGTRGAPVLA